MNKLIKSAIISAITALIIFSPAVAGANLTPVWNPVYTKYGAVGRTLQFNVSAWDPDGDRLSYYATSLPLYASFDKERQLFSWIPKETGTYLARFRVFDNFYSFSDLEVILEISNKPPAFGNDFGNGNVGGGSGAGGENRPQIIIINTQPAQPTQPIAQSPAPIAKSETVLSDVVDDDENKDAGKITNNSSQSNRLSLAATLIGIADNILLNPWLLIVLVAVLLILLYRCAKKREMLEQELALKRNHEASKPVSQ